MACYERKKKVMKICERGVNFVQIIDAKGNCRSCSWMQKNHMGSILENDFESLYHGEAASEVRKHLIDGTYENCKVDNCPYLANGTIEEHLLDISDIPQYPTELYLAYEGKCNYNCTCCTSYQNMQEAKQENWEDNYDKIEQEIRKILPHITTISANGRGELFCSSRILKLLSDWQPLAPESEISVILETNGSLFNEVNWKKIENLGKYNLRVAITVMSFQEDVYQYLSGTRLPISNIINNLHYVKRLHEEGIINELELATVLQEQNFREMPEFVRKCIEEFGADVVRIRPILPGGMMQPHVQWFMDVRNPKHPYYYEYRKVMENPIFRNPKVLLWSGEYDSERGECPGIQENRKNRKILNIVGEILAQEKFIDNFATYLERENINEISYYGIGKIASLVLALDEEQKKIKIKKLYDNFSENSSFKGYSIDNPRNGTYCNSKNEVILVFVLEDLAEIEAQLRCDGFEGRILFIEDVVNKIKKY